MRARSSVLVVSWVDRFWVDAIRDVRSSGCGKVAGFSSRVLGLRPVGFSWLLRGLLVSPICGLVTDPLLVVGKWVVGCLMHDRERRSVGSGSCVSRSVCVWFDSLIFLVLGSVLWWFALAGVVGSFHFLMVGCVTCLDFCSGTLDLFFRKTGSTSKDSLFRLMIWDDYRKVVWILLELMIGSL